MHICAPVLLSIASILYDGANWPLCPLVCTKRFMALEPFMFIATPFWWCEPLLSPSGFFRSSSLLFDVAKRYHGLLSFPFRSHSFLVMRMVCASLRLVSWLLSFDRDILHECKMVQPILVLPSSIFRTCRGQVLCRCLTF